MAKKREYRMIPVNYPDDPAVRDLTANATYLELLLKLKLGASGIAERSPEQTRRLTKLSEEDAAAAWRELEATGRLVTDGYVSWLVHALGDDPNYTPENVNLRKGVVAHVDGLPPSPVVDAFRTRYADWFGGATPTGPGGGERPDSEGGYEAPLKPLVEGVGNPSAEGFIDAPTEGLPIPVSKGVQYGHYVLPYEGVYEGVAKPESRKTKSETSGLLLSPPPGRTRSADGKGGAPPVAALAEGVPPRRGAPAYSAAFEAAWRTYWLDGVLRRPNNNKAEAWDAWRARVAEGETESQLADGTAAKAALVAREIEQRRRTRDPYNARFTPQACTFYGRHRHYRAAQAEAAALPSETAPLLRVV